MKVPDLRRRYTPEEKQQLIKNLDIEVEHRVRQLEEWLAVALTNFKLHQEGLISRIPKLMRSVKMGDFADKYDGDVQACLRGLQRERLGNAEELEIDRETRKRKWAAALEESEASGSGTGANDSEPPRALKTARVVAATPKRKGASSNTFAVTNTPGTSRNPIRAQPSPSPYKLGKPPPFVPVRSTSPSKLTNGTTHHQPHRTRMPSSATFNPSMPTQAPTYPALRAPRRDESMLSVNGSPLANPYSLGLGWFAGEQDGVNAPNELAQSKHKGTTKEKTIGKPKGLKRVNSIVIRRDPSAVLGGSSQRSSLSLQSHSRTNSQSTTHSRSNSRTQILVPESSAAVTPKVDLIQLPPTVVSSASASALVSLPTKDGHLLEFDPLNTSPSALDALVGITDSAKKQAREEMARLVKEAVRKWAIE
ncbi:hypothetical protein EDC04DRAFT_3128022 [Pisolithus marmoratus]|nr:hypothetical protein EDC04DRAFT_3128022 [Pisolithus marmoratus]